MLKKLPWTIPLSNSSDETRIWGITRRLDLLTPNDDLDCDHLANADRLGNGITKPPSPEARRRVALEWGSRSWFRSTREYMSCVDQRWDDPRTENDKLIQSYVDSMGPPGPDDIVWKNPMKEVLWESDDRLKGFENAFWDVGGKAAGST